MSPVRIRTVVAFVTGAILTIVGAATFRAWPAGAAPGETDATYVPLSPCRLIDTRPSPDRVGTLASFGADTTQVLVARGSIGNCSIPGDAVGLALNVTALGASAPTFLTVWPDGPRPLAASLNPTPGEPPTPNAVNTKLSAAGTFSIYNLAGSVDVIVDVTGYFTAASLAALAERVDELAAALPFSVAARNDSITLPVVSPATIVSVQVSAPFDGNVTVASTTTITEATPKDGAVCWITDNSNPNVIATDFEQKWESPGPAGQYGQLSGTRMFTIAGGTTVTYHLRCYGFGSLPPTQTLTDAVLTAIYTPAA